MLPNNLDEDVIDLKKHEQFKGREKEIYRFAFKGKDEAPQIDEIMEKLELLEKANLTETEVAVAKSKSCDMEFGDFESAEKYFHKM